MNLSLKPKLGVNPNLNTSQPLPSSYLSQPAQPYYQPVPQQQYYPQQPQQLPPQPRRIGLSQDEIEELKEAFNLFDVDGSGTIDAKV